MSPDAPYLFLNLFNNVNGYAFELQCTPVHPAYVFTYIMTILLVHGGSPAAGFKVHPQRVKYSGLDRVQYDDKPACDMATW